MISTDVLIIGSGIAGLTTAIKIADAAPELNILVLSKAHSVRESNTGYAQGGVASVWDFTIDNFEKHISDTLLAGDGLCDPRVVRFVVEEGHERVQELIEWGVRFDRDSSGNIDLGREGGHSESRVLHFKDSTGREIMRALIEQAASRPAIRILANAFAVDLITEHHLGYNVTRLTPEITCFGAYVLQTDSSEVQTVVARRTVVATGGAGQMYQATTNPVLATGDGIAMVYRAKGRISNMEFVQFHPTSLYDPFGANPAFLISEAVRGAGAVLRTIDGTEFMPGYDERGSLAPRDIVARAIDSELKRRGDDFVGLDCSSIDPEEFAQHFPNILSQCRDKGMDPAKDLIPVVPACHYLCGGVQVDPQGRTSIKQLYAAGECTNSGLHGANRLASNSLLEGLVFGHRVCQDLLNGINKVPLRGGIPAWTNSGTTDPDEMVLITQSHCELKDIMSSYVGIVRSDERLKRSMDRLGLLYQETERVYDSTTLTQRLCELRNLITIGYLVTRSAAMRHESRGLHYTTDYPGKIEPVQSSYL